MKIDIFPHILPPKYLEAVSKKSVRDVTNLIENNVKFFTTLHDLDQRFRIMDKYDGLVQVLTLSSPPLEAIAEPKVAAELGMIANDEIAELVRKHPDRFVAGVATLPMNDVDAALREAERAIKELGLRGIQTWTNVNGKPLDLPEFLPLFELMTQYDLPIWIHPRRDVSQPDYPNEPISKYNTVGILGWEFETTLAMARLVYGGVLVKYPGLKIITHHAGGYASLIERRFILCDPQAFDPSRPDSLNYNPALRYRGERPWVEYFQSFYNDTAVYGSTPALMCAHSFFGTDHLLFGTDMPYDNEQGEILVRDTILSVERMDIPQSDKTKIFEDNARKLLRLPL